MFSCCHPCTPSKSLRSPRRCVHEENAILSQRASPAACGLADLSFWGRLARFAVVRGSVLGAGAGPDCALSGNGRTCGTEGRAQREGRFEVARPCLRVRQSDKTT
eukprot:878007-Alexandrium_andersonii.AAC.1